MGHKGLNRVSFKLVHSATVISLRSRRLEVVVQEKTGAREGDTRGETLLYDHVLFRLAYGIKLFF